MKQLEAGELRIGNWIKCESISIPRLEISSDGFMKITGYGISVLESDTNNKLNWCPISLTEDWLKRAGFKKNPVSYSIQISYFPDTEYKDLSVSLNQGILIRSGNLEDARSDDNIIALINTDVSGPIYVHQLQNLYFALTNTELIFK